jgi:hypothetical protein
MTDRGLLTQRALYAGLDALRSVLLTDLAACIHAVSGAPPQLYLRQPTLGDLGASEAIKLYEELRHLLDQDDLPRIVGVGGRSACACITVGVGARTLWVVGRHEPAFDDGEADVVVSLAEAVGAVVAAIEETAHTLRQESVSVSVEGSGRISRAEVWVPVGSRVRASRSEGASPMIAVAQATLAAVDEDLKLATAAEDTIDGERAVLVLARNPMGRAAVGAAVCDDDPLLATARAALDAARSLSG